jgi:hypothetical protein
MSDAALGIGDRVRLSDQGRKSFMRTPDRRGTVVSVSSTQTRYRVRWDGQTGAEFIHRTYLESDAEGNVF